MPEESAAPRRVIRSAVLGMLLVGMLIVLAMPIPLLLTDVPFGFVLIGAVVLTATCGVFLWVWATRNAEDHDPHHSYLSHRDEQSVVEPREQEFRERDPHTEAPGEQEFRQQDVAERDEFRTEPDSERG